jgi:hypothetical protein
MTKWQIAAMATLCLAASPAVPLPCSGDACGAIKLSSHQQGQWVLQDIINSSNRPVKVTIGWSSQIGGCGNRDFHVPAHNKVSVNGLFCNSFTASFE